MLRDTRVHYAVQYFILTSTSICSLLFLTVKFILILIALSISRVTFLPAVIHFYTNKP